MDAASSAQNDVGLKGGGTDTPTSVSPNSVSDQPATIDKIGFEPYVQAVSAFLCQKDTQPPLTLSVEGTWGSGKSSFMLQLEDRIQKEAGKTVWFNAWRHDKEEELWAAFALHFTEELAKKLPFWKRCLLHLKVTVLRFDWGRGWYQVAKFVVLSALFVFISFSTWTYYYNHPSSMQQLYSSAHDAAAGKKTDLKPQELALTLLLGVGGASASLLLAFAGIRKISEVVGNPLRIPLTNYIRDPKYEARAAFIETFHSDFARLVKTYAGNGRVFVFIDDLDRCDVPKAAELMRAINLLISESTPIVYILGLDREKIAAGLAAKYEKLLPYLSSKKDGPTIAGLAGIEFGYEFLEKFIQIPFTLPQPTDKDVDELLDSLGSQARESSGKAEKSERIDSGLLVKLSADSIYVRDVVKMVAPALDYNPRRLKQFLNLFRLRALLASQTGLFGSSRNERRFNPLTLDQLGKLVAISLRWPLLFVDLEDNRDLLRDLQNLVWNDPPAKSGPDYPRLEYWSANLNLLRLIAFPAEFPAKERITMSNSDEARYGLGRIDVDRLLQVSPTVPGREFSESRHLRQPQKAEKGKGESLEENKERATGGWDYRDDNPVGGPPREAIYKKS